MILATLGVLSSVAGKNLDVFAVRQELRTAGLCLLSHTGLCKIR